MPAIECPRCGLLSPQDAVRCDCGLAFSNEHRGNAARSGRVPPALTALWAIAETGATLAAAAFGYIFGAFSAPGALSGDTVGAAGGIILLVLGPAGVLVVLYPAAAILTWRLRSRGRLGLRTALVGYLMPALVLVATLIAGYFGE